MRNLPRLLLIVACGLVSSIGARAEPTAVEYYHGGYGHYFVTALEAEKAALDRGAPPGWVRTGAAFEVLPAGTYGAASVCRFWSDQTYAPKSSHFYTSNATECVERRDDPAWTFEGEVFALLQPDGAGACPDGTLPLYRLYNDGMGGAPNHRYTTSLTIRAEMLVQGWVAEGLGRGVIGCTVASLAPTLVRGKVIDGWIESAVVCHDANRNGRCDSGEPQTSTDASGAYELTMPRDSTAPLVAEVIAGRSRDSDEPDSLVDVSYRMSSPARAYGTDITPFSTLVQLTGRSDYLLAEDQVRGLLGLPPYFDLRMSAPAAAGSLKRSVAGWVVKALKANGLALDLSAASALDTVVSSFALPLATLPRLVITTRDGAPVESREVYVDATYVLTNPAAAVPTVTLNGRIRGRGHSTWGQPKNPYKVQFSNDASYAAIADVLGMKKQRNWALLADYFDRSLIRNKLALSLGSSSVFNDGIKWTPSGQHLEVWLNGDYVGVYLLTEDIRIDPARLNIRKMSSSASVNDVDGGYIVEVDARLDCYNQGDVNLQLVTPQGVPICIDTPDEESITQNQLAWIKSYVVQAEADLYGPRRLEKVNATSYVDAYLIQELFRNVDSNFYSSVFMWKDTAAATNPKDRVLNLGPLWDFDRGAGNVNYFDGWMSEGCWASKDTQPNWLSRMFDNPDFLALTLSRWKQKRAALEAFVNFSIDTFARRLVVAAQQNFRRWPIFDVQLTNYYVFSSHDEEVAFVRRYLNERMLWLDKAFASEEAFNAMCK